MWRISIRLLSDTNNIFFNSSSRVLKRCPLSLQQELHSSYPASEGSFFVQSNKEEYRFWAPLCSHQQRRFYHIGTPLFTQQICFSVSHFTAQRQATLRLTGSSRVYNQHLLGVISRVFHKNSHFLVQDCRCLASCPSSIFSACKVKGSGALQFSRSDFRTQLHSAALAVFFDDPQETTSCHLPSFEGSSSQPRITDVHGTLNSVLWGIPMIADQMSSKPAEDQIVMENGTLSAQAMTELEYVRFSPPSSPSFLEALAVPASNYQPEVPPLREHMDELNAQTFPIEITQATKKRKTLDLKSQKLRNRQLKVESYAWQRATDDYRKQIAQMCKNQRAPSLPFMKALFLSWFEPLTKAITAEQEAYKNGKLIAERRYGPYLDLLPADMLAVITMHKTVAKLLTDDVSGGLRVIIPIMSIGEAVEEEVGLGKRTVGDHQSFGLLPKMVSVLSPASIYQDGSASWWGQWSGGAPLESEKVFEHEELDFVASHERKAWVRLQNIMKKPKPKGVSQAKEAADEQLLKHKHLQRQVQKMVKQGKRQALRRKLKLKEIDSSEPWSSVVRAQVGSRLLELLLETAYIQDPGDNPTDGSVEIRPAFRHSIKTISGKKSGLKNTHSKSVGVIECDSFISKGFHNMAHVVVIPYMPMLVKPLPWQGYRKGGHLVLPTRIMRTHGAKELAETLKRTPKHQLKAVFDALNILGATKWRINNRVLEIVEKIWGEGGGIADIVDRADVPEPQKPETDDVDALKKWRWDLLRVKRTNRELHSLRCDMQLKLSVAREMKNEECFYYPHNVDFRGRAYPLHPHLNHLGSDMCRGLLEFAEGCPLKNTGLSWLKIQLANLYGNGVDKLSFEDRIAFVEKNLDNIMESANKPLEGCRWWLAAEDPFQCLATCMEISNALSSPDVESFISHLPVHQDGSCNGLQHYAALGRDILGAESVNLTAQQKPADVYTGIAIR
ncbi:hypothetical protein L7F22_000919 [Adiantum nelumboides]|nr:hypothetical protein [Adiantum nelumboides]